jgi:hypothetical protein
MGYPGFMSLVTNRTGVPSSRESEGESGRFCGYAVVWDVFW